MKGFPSLEIRKVASLDEMPIELLLLADPSIEHIKAYTEKGHCFTASIKHVIIAVLVLLELNVYDIEIKNIAVLSSYQKKGFGYQLIEFAEQYAKKNHFEKLLVGTANSSIYQFAFYQKAGFEVVSVEKDFFLENYGSSIFENGIQAKHKMLLQKIIS